MTASRYPKKTVIIHDIAHGHEYNNVLSEYIYDETGIRLVSYNNSNMPATSVESHGMIIEGKLEFLIRAEMENGSIRWVVSFDGKELCGTPEELAVKLENLGALRTSREAAKIALAAIISTINLRLIRAYTTYSLKDNGFPDPRVVFPDDTTDERYNAIYLEKHEPADEELLEFYRAFYENLSESSRIRNQIISGTASIAPIAHFLRRRGCTLVGVGAHGDAGTAKTGMAILGTSLYGIDSEHSARDLTSEWRQASTIDTPAAKAFGETARLFSNPQTVEYLKAFSAAEFGITGKGGKKNQLHQSEAIIFATQNANPLAELDDENLAALPRRILFIHITEPATNVDEAVAPLVLNGARFGTYMLLIYRQIPPEKFAKWFTRIRNAIYSRYKERAAMLAGVYLGVCLHGAIFTVPVTPEAIFNVVDTQEVRRDSPIEKVHNLLSALVQKYQAYVSLYENEYARTKSMNEAYDLLSHSEKIRYVVDGDYLLLRTGVVEYLCKEIPSLNVSTLKDLCDKLGKICEVKYQSTCRGPDEKNTTGAKVFLTKLAPNTTPIQHKSNALPTEIIEINNEIVGYVESVKSKIANKPPSAACGSAEQNQPKEPNISNKSQFSEDKTTLESSRNDVK